jgi:hypothetical protein
VERSPGKDCEMTDPIENVWVWVVGGLCPRWRLPNEEAAELDRQRRSK